MAYTQYIIPAIIPISAQDLMLHVDALPVSIREIQIDLVGSTRLDAQSWPYSDDSHDFVSCIQKLTNRFEIEIDAMVDDTDTCIAWSKEAGVKKVVIHLEYGDSLTHRMKEYKRQGIEIGVATNNNTPVQVIFDAIAQGADYVQCMGISQIGTQGMAFDESVLSRIATIAGRFPNVPIRVDGSMNRDTIERVYRAGARAFVVGSAIFAGMRDMDDDVARARSVQSAYADLEHALTRVINSVRND